MICEACHNEIPQGDECPNCGFKQPKIICLSCFRRFYKSFFIDGVCSECYEKELKLKAKNPYIAGGLSIIPGLGQLYNGQKNEGIIYLFIFGMTLIVPVIGWFFSLGVIGLAGINAFRTAQRTQYRAAHRQ